MRKIVFSRLAMEFGPQYWEREKYELPLPKRMTEDEVLDQLARYLTRLIDEKVTISAIDAQLAWAKTEEKGVKKSQVKQYILCKAAAHEVGLIRSQPTRSTTLGK